MRTCKIAVLMSTFNGAKYLSQQIDSILSQTVSDCIRLFVRDDGSSDSTLEILNEYQKKHPNQISVFSGDNIGLNASFFWLIRNINGFDFYSISDQDDVWQIDKIEVAINHLERHEIGKPLLYASSSYLVKDDLIPYGETRKKKRDVSLYNSLIQNFCPGHTQVFNEKLRRIVSSEIDISHIYVYDSWILNVAVLYGELIFDNSSHTLYRQHDRNQLGSGRTFFQKILLSRKRVQKGHGHLYARQIKYFDELFADRLEKDGCHEEINSFLKKRCFISRAFYSFRAKFYRQTVLETIAFYLAYVFGKFNV